MYKTVYFVLKGVKRLEQSQSKELLLCLACFLLKYVLRVFHLICEQIYCEKMCIIQSVPPVVIEVCNFETWFRSSQKRLLKKFSCI